MIEFDSVDLAYDGVNLFKNFTLRIEGKEKILITGPSGCGKTSLFKLLLGFTRPDSGEIRFNDSVLNKKNIGKIRGDIFYLSQDIDFRNEKVSTLILEIFEYDRNKATSYDDTLIKKYMDILELETNILDKDIMKLSGGERQRVGLLICFLLNRPVLLLDEPTSALDEKMKKNIADIFSTEDKTVLIISHDDVFHKNGKYKKVELENGNI